jgi:hypothetical protein
MQEQYQKLKEEYLEDNAKGVKGKKYPKQLDPKDIDLLEDLQNKSKFYPFLFSIPAVAVYYGLTQLLSISLLKNPLRKVDDFKVKSSRLTRLTFFFSGALVIMPIVHIYHVNKFKETQTFVYNRYRPLVDDYVVHRDELTLAVQR